MPKKDDRLQLRMEPGLKEWFKQDAEPDGGMSRVVTQQVEARFLRKTGQPWRGPAHAHHAPGDEAEAPGHDDRGATDPD